VPVSIILPVFNRKVQLLQAIQSVCDQTYQDWELIVVDDGSPTGETEEVCQEFPIVRYLRIWRQPGYGNPAIPRNVAYQAARGEVLICQSDDVLHGDGNIIEQLVGEMQEGRFVLATVRNVDEQLRPVGCGHPRNPRLVELCGPVGRRPLFFLGAVYRRDVYEIGGNDERFVAPGKEDRYFVDCLTKGLGLTPYFSSARGFHLHHARPSLDTVLPSDEVYGRLIAEGRWRAAGAPWMYTP